MKAATLINTAFATIDFKYQTFKNRLFVLIPLVAYNFPPVIEKIPTQCTVICKN